MQRGAVVKWLEAPAMLKCENPKNVMDNKSCSISEERKKKKKKSKKRKHKNHRKKRYICLFCLFTI